MKNKRLGQPGGSLAMAVIGITVAAVFTTGVSAVATAAAPRRPWATTEQLALTPAQRSAWRAMTDTPEKRQEIARIMVESFTQAGIAVRTAASGAIGAVPTGRSVQTVALPAPQYAAGIAWDHVWVILSYLDVARGLIAAAVGFCMTRLPGWICTAVGAVLYAIANGWGYASNHGVWAAIYWFPYPHYTYGRW